VLGVYASAHAVPLAAKVEAQKKILWITSRLTGGLRRRATPPRPRTAATRLW
jgi:hypothetical protein